MATKYTSKAIISWEDDLPMVKIESLELEATIHVKDVYLEYKTPSGIDAINLKEMKEKLEIS